MAISEGFATFLAPRLAIGATVRVYHTSSRPAPCPPLYVPSPGQSEGKTWCESHFLALSQQPQLGADPATESRLLVLGLEVLIFTSEDLTTVFVSKADTTGFLQRKPNARAGHSIAFIAISSFLEFLIKPRLVSHRVVLSLFARSQNQYLFPGSIENVSKRILDDRQLIKWWCRVLDPIARSQHRVATSHSTSEVKAYLVVPGCERQETKAFFPPSVRQDPASNPKWIDRYPVDLLLADVSLPPRYLVPRLPDDPKARFLDDLDGAQVKDDGTWKGVKSLDQFWEMMSYRQECSAGRLVGFVWVVFSNLVRSVAAAAPVNPSRRDPRGHISPATTIQSIPSQTEVSTEDPGILGPPSAAHVATRRPDTLAVSTASGVGLHAQFSQGQGQHPVIVDPGVSSEEAHAPWPTSTRGQLTLDPVQYTGLMDFLLELDFAGEETAKQSTQEWIDKAKDLAAVADFGLDVLGSLELSESRTTGENETVATNVLTIARKRKADPIESATPAPVTSVNTLSTNLVRKKPKS